MLHGTVNVVVKLVPVDLWQRIKAQAALEGKTLRAFVVEMMESRLKKAKS